VRVLALLFQRLFSQFSKKRVACCLISVVSAIHRFSLAVAGPFFRWFSCISATKKKQKKNKQLITKKINNFVIKQRENQ